MIQNDLIKEFKYCAVGDQQKIISQMNAETAVSLLSIPTKNVRNKLFYTTMRDEIRGSDALNSLVAVVAKGHNPVEYKTLVDFLNDHNILDKHASWDLFFNHSDEMEFKDFLSFVQENSYNNATIPETFFKKHLNDRFFEFLTGVHRSITDSFLRYKASQAEKIAILNLYNGTSTVRIDIRVSYPHFQDVPYEDIKTFLLKNIVYSQYFLDVIKNNNDFELIKTILINNCSIDNVESEFNHFTFNEKIELLKETQRDYLEIKEIISKNEYKEFIRIAFNHDQLFQYIKDLEVKDFNEELKLADVLGQITDQELFIPELDKKDIDNLSIDNIKRVLMRGRVPLYLKPLFYARLTRTEIVELLGPLEMIEDFNMLGRFMTQTELEKCQSKDIKFIRKNLPHFSKTYLEKYKDKKLFKELVGDRRNSSNNSFGHQLENIINQKIEEVA